MIPAQLLQKIQNLYIRSRFLANNLFTGEYETAFRGRGMEFEEFREYIPGDDIRLIDWNVCARMNHPFVKVHREEREQTLMLMVDISASQNFGSKKRLKKDVVAEMAAVLAFAAIKSNDKVGLILFSDKVECYIPPKKGRSHVWYVISKILSYQPHGKKTDIKGTLGFFNQVIHRRSVCFLISDFYSEGYETALKAASYNHDLIALMIHDPLEMNFPSAGIMALQDQETNEVLSINLSNRKQRERFRYYQGKKIHQKKDHLKSLGIDCLLIQSDKDYIDIFLRFFRQREHRL